VGPKQSTSTRFGHNASSPEHHEVSLLTQIKTYVNADVVEAAAKAAATAKVVVNFMMSEDGLGIRRRSKVGWSTSRDRGNF
jgi:hypothetical protein